MTTRLIALGVLLTPAVVLAQPNPDDAHAPAPPPAQATPLPPRPRFPDVALAPAAMGDTRVEPQYQVVTDPYNARRFMAGAFVFAASYGAAFVVAATTDPERGNDRLYIPLVGPWLALGERGDCDSARSSCDHETTAKVLLVADGVFQAAGILGMIDGVLRPSKRLVVVRSATLEPRLHVRPAMVHGAPGLSVSGRF